MTVGACSAKRDGQRSHAYQQETSGGEAVHRREKSGNRPCVAEAIGQGTVEERLIKNMNMNVLC